MEVSWALHGDTLDGWLHVSHMGFNKLMLMVFCLLSKICRLPRSADTKGGVEIYFLFISPKWMYFIDSKCVDPPCQLFVAPTSFLNLVFFQQHVALQPQWRSIIVSGYVCRRVAERVAYFLRPARIRWAHFPRRNGKEDKNTNKLWGLMMWPGGFAYRNNKGNYLKWGYCRK